MAGLGTELRIISHGTRVQDLMVSLSMDWVRREREEKEKLTFKIYCYKP